LLPKGGGLAGTQESCNVGFVGGGINVFYARTRKINLKTILILGFDIYHIFLFLPFFKVKYFNRGDACVPHHLLAS
jgi:hypothetical protein